jgi:3-oxoacid CoA-transferase
VRRWCCWCPCFLHPCCLWNYWYAHSYLIINLANLIGLCIVQTGELPVRYNKDGTIAEYSKPKETREFNGKAYILEESIFGDYALIKVDKADKLGNCQFRKAQNNFNEAMAKNAKYTIVEADHIVEVGEIAPEEIHLQAIYVNKVIQSTEKKQIEKLTFAKDPSEMLQAGASP